MTARNRGPLPLSTDYGPLRLKPPCIVQVTQGHFSSIINFVWTMAEL